MLIFLLLTNALNSIKIITVNNFLKVNIMEKKLLFVYNPISGKSQIKNHLFGIINKFTEAGYLVSVHPTQARKDGYNYIKEHLCEYDMLSVCGGDGMLNEAVSAVMSVEKAKRPSVLLIPGGSTNDFANTLGVPTDIPKVAEKINNSKPFFCDLGRFNDSDFVYVAAFGVFTAVSYDTPQDLKNKFGHLAYLISGIKELTTIKPFRVKISYDDKVIEDDFIFGMVTNSLQVGGFKRSKNPEFSLNDGMFEVVLVKNPKNAIGYQQILSDILTQNFNTKHFITFKTSDIAFESEENIPWTLDGEYGGETNKAKINIIEKAFSVML